MPLLLPGPDNRIRRRGELEEAGDATHHSPPLQQCPGCQQPRHRRRHLQPGKSGGLSLLAKFADPPSLPLEVRQMLAEGQPVQLAFGKEESSPELEGLESVWFNHVWSFLSSPNDPENAS